MKNKGFTLVELLAVIVVLSIIALIGYSTVGNIISSSQDSSNKVTMKNYAKAVDQAIFLYEMNNSDSNLSELNSTWLKENVKFEKATVECEYATYDKTSSLYGCKINDSDKTYCYTSDTAVECNKDKLSKIYGNSIQNGTPTPTSPVEIKSVGEKTKNLIPYPYTYTKTWTEKGVTFADNGDGSITVSGTATDYAAFIITQYLLVDSSKTYTLSFNATNVNNIAFQLREYDKDKKHLNNIDIYNLSDVYIYKPSTSAVKYISFYIKRNNNVACSGTIRPQLEVGSTATSYEPYGYRIPITVSNGNDTKTTNIYLKEPLRKIGEYADYLDLTNKKVVRNVKELILNGTENWTKYTTVNNHYQLIVGDNYFSRDTNSILSNYYIKATSGSYNSSLNYAVISADANRIRFKDKDISTIEDWKNKLVGYADNNKPLKVIYQLANETEENIEVPSIPELSEGQKCEDFYKVNGANIECGY